MGFDLLNFHRELAKQGIIFCFRGPVSQQVIEGIGQTLRQKMELEDAGMTTVKKVFTIFVEQMQNVVNYSAEKVGEDELSDGELRVGVLVVGREDNRFYVLCGNSVLKEQTERIKNRLDVLREMNEEQLKAFYRERRKMGASLDSKGAGLGFIDMARKAGRPMEYGFAPLDNQHEFFSIKVVI